jgi:hypothetical protein
MRGLLVLMLVWVSCGTRTGLPMGAADARVEVVPAGDAGGGDASTRNDSPRADAALAPPDLGGPADAPVVSDVQTGCTPLPVTMLAEPTYGACPPTAAPTECQGNDVGAVVARSAACVNAWGNIPLQCVTWPSLAAGEEMVVLELASCTNSIGTVAAAACGDHIEVSYVELASCQPCDGRRSIWRAFTLPLDARPVIATGQLFVSPCPDAATGTGGAGGAGGARGTGGVTMPGTGGSATGGSSGGTGGAPADCAGIAAEIASQTGLVGTCTAVVRLDYRSLEILAHAFVCGKYATPDEAMARATASADAVFPYASPAGEGKLLSGPSPPDEWVFYQEPTDFGGAAAVSARSGLTVFAGSIVWMGTGKIMVPAAWDTSDLGPGCGQPMGWSARGFDLSGGQATDHMMEAADVVLATALPSAFARWGSLLDVVVLLYPRSVGAFDPSTAEYIVLLNAGWLE